MPDWMCRCGDVGCSLCEDDCPKCGRRKFTLAKVCNRCYREGDRPAEHKYIHWPGYNICAIPGCGRRKDDPVHSGEDDRG